MILTPHFVLLQFPRTATRFCKSVIVGKIPEAKEYWGDGPWNKHNYRHGIPQEWKHLPVVGVKRDILDLWASWYCAGIAINEKSFEDYYRRINEIGGNIGDECKGGNGFMRKYRNVMFRNGQENIDDVLFLDFEKMNQEIYMLLKGYGHDDPSILNKPPVEVGVERAGKPWEEIIDPLLADEIIRGES